jgi:hypothetical protein
LFPAVGSPVYFAYPPPQPLILGVPIWDPENSKVPPPLLGQPVLVIPLLTDPDEEIPIMVWGKNHVVPTLISK